MVAKKSPNIPGASLNGRSLATGCNFKDGVKYSRSGILPLGSCAYESGKMPLLR
jgi:hypothetical protein